MPPISVLLKPSSSLCNMSCDYCFYCDEASKREVSSYGFMEETTLKNMHPPDASSGRRICCLCLSGWRAYAPGAGFFPKSHGISEAV